MTISMAINNTNGNNNKNKNNNFYTGKKRKQSINLFDWYESLTSIRIWSKI